MISNQRLTRSAMSKPKERPQHRYAHLLDDVDYKNVNLLRTFISNYQKILPRKRFGLTAKQQRNLTQAVKRARYMALLPYTNDQK